MTGSPVPELPDQSAAPAPGPLTITRILLLDPHGHDPILVESITFDDDGIGVVRYRGQDSRILPWEAVIAHAVEPWAGGVIPEWWVDPAHQLPDRPEPSTGNAFAPLPASSDTTGRQLPHADAGALISIQTRTGTYRFLRSGANPYDLAARVAELAVRHQGPAGVSTVTTVAPGRARHYRRADRVDRAVRAERAERAGRDDRAERRADRAERADRTVRTEQAGRADRAGQAERRAAGTNVAVDRSGWQRAHTLFIALAVVVIATVVAVILLQSAGVIHLPFLGSGAQSSLPASTMSS